MKKEQIRQMIEEGSTQLRIMLDRTGITTTLTDEAEETLAKGYYAWTPEDLAAGDVSVVARLWRGMADSYGSLRDAVEQEYGYVIRKVKNIGVRSEMSGYYAFNGNEMPLTPFCICPPEADPESEQAAGFRGTASRLYADMLQDAAYVKDVHYVTTLAGYIHWTLCGRVSLGIGDASRLMETDADSGAYSEAAMERLNALAAAKGLEWKAQNLFPTVLKPGDKGGYFSKKGALILDDAMRLQASPVMCPPEMA